MTDSANTLEPFIKRREKNLAYFKDNFKEIYNLFKDYKLKNLHVNILTENDEVNLLREGRHIYESGAKVYAEEEVTKFRHAYKEGKKICSFIPPFYGDYKFPRFGQIAVNELLEKSPIRKDNFLYYGLQDFYPLIVFLGCGLGYHIEKMVNEHNVQNLLVVEPDLDKFAASLYAIDWADICSRYKSSNGKTLHFIIGAEESEYLIWAVTWNKLIELSPHFPVTTLFYNHQGRELFDNVSERVNKDLLVFLLSWGHYDDEIRQLNNALHNFHLGVKELPPPLKDPSHTPVFVIGAGPSLDGRIEYIKSVRDRAILISCGTALKTLATYGVKPDIHVELESDLLAYIAVSRAADEEFYRDIKLIGPSHISPLIYQLFGDGRMYYKAESALAELFGKGTGHIINNGTPTCTNLGVALAISMGFKRVFLFGLDFGFEDINHHHAKGSIYYEKLLKQEHKERDLVRIETVKGGDAWSTPNYFTSKRKVENLIQQNSTDEALQVFNCSDVAKIEGAEWLEKDTFVSIVRELESKRAEDLAYMFSDNATQMPLSKIESKLHYLLQNFEALPRDIEKIFADQANNLEQFSILVGRLNWYLEDVVRKGASDFYFYIRGTLRHFMCAGFAHAFACDNEEQQREYINIWKQSVLAFFESVPEHFKSVVYKDFDIESDPWLKQAITDTEDGINPFFTEDLENLQLDY